MERTSLHELRTEFKEKTCNFTEEEKEELTFFGFVALKDYKEHCLENCGGTNNEN